MLQWKSLYVCGFRETNFLADDILMTLQLKDLVTEPYEDEKKRDIKMELSDQAIRSWMRSYLNLHVSYVCLQVFLYLISVTKIIGSGFCVGDAEAFCCVEMTQL